MNLDLDRGMDMEMGMDLDRGMGMGTDRGMGIGTGVDYADKTRHARRNVPWPWRERGRERLWMT